MHFYDVKTKINSDGKPVEIGFPYAGGAYKIRTLDKKGFYAKGDIAKGGLFGRSKFSTGGHKYVTITEGELDALSLYQVLGTPVVSVQSAATAGRDCTLERSWLNSFERVYLAFDGDPAGQDAASAVAKLFDHSKVFLVKFSNRKDANEYLQAGEAQELKNIWLNSKKYMPEEIISSLADFKKILEQPPKLGVPYPFKKLTEMTYGIRLGETVLFTAQEKVGKTELMHFIEHKLLRETEEDVNIAAIYLEEPKDRHLQSLAGIELNRPLHLPGSLCPPDEVFGAIQKVVKKDERLHLYSYFGSRDPDILLDAIRFLVSACGCRYVIFDHLSMVLSGSAGESDERRAFDYISTRLEMMVKELNFALIIVSHVNDDGKVRGSRYPTKVFDITVTATRDLQHPDPRERSSIYLRVLFNRFSGNSGPAGKIVFNPDTYSFEEEDFSDVITPNRTQAMVF